MDSAPNNSRHLALPFYKLILRCLIFTFIFSIVSLLLIVGISAIFYKSPDPTSKTLAIGMASVYSSIFISSFIMTKINKEKWLFGGLFLGIMVLALITLLSSFFNSNADAKDMISNLFIPLVSLISAFLGRKKEGKKPKIKHR